MTEETRFAGPAAWEELRLEKEALQVLVASDGWQRVVRAFEVQAEQMLQSAVAEEDCIVMSKALGAFGALKDATTYPSKRIDAINMQLEAVKRTTR